LKRAIVLLTLCVLFVCVGAIRVSAGAVSSGGSSGGGSSTGGGFGEFFTPLEWRIVRNLDKDVVLKDTHTRITPQPTQDIPKGSSVAYVTTNTYKIGGKDVQFPNRWYRWVSWMVEGHGDPANQDNLALWSSSMLLPKDFIDEVLTVEYNYEEIKKGALYKKGQEYVDAIWLDPAIEIVKKSCSFSCSRNKNYTRNNI
jgi:hypothetical protein